MHPYDLRIPPIDADLQVWALDKTNPVSLLKVVVKDPDGKQYQGYTDLFGRCGWDFDNMKKGKWRAEVPAQGKYADSSIDFEAKSGDLSVTFVSNPRLLIEALTTTRYAYSTQTDMAFNLVYDQGGRLNVPISIVARPMPTNWTFSYMPPVLGENGISAASVSLNIPSGQYVQPVMDFWGISGSITYTGTDEATINKSVTINRGFPISVTSHFDFYLDTGSTPDQFWGWFYITCANCPFGWSGNLMIGDTIMGPTHYFASASNAYACGVTYNAENLIQAQLPSYYVDNIPNYSVSIASPVGSHCVSLFTNNKSFNELKFEGWQYYTLGTTVY